jgi:hypothetical protein
MLLEADIMISRSFEALKLLPVALLNQKVNFSE